MYVRINGNPVSLLAELNTDMLSLEIFPTPATQETDVVYSLPAAGQVVWQLTDAIGKSYPAHISEAAKGQNSKRLQDIFHYQFTNGVYYLKMTANEKTIVKKFVVVQ